MNQTVELYKGCRNYWRLRTNIDFHIVEHVALKVVEVVAYHPTLRLEAERIYLSLPILMSKIDAGKLASAISAKKEDFIRRRRAFDDSELCGQVKSGLLSDYILSRATVSTSDNDTAFHFTLTPFQSDMVNGEGSLDCVVPMPPTLKPIEITRAMTTCSGDFETTFQALKLDSMKLSAACNHADRLAKLTSMSSEGFKNLLKITKQEGGELLHLSIGKRRWKKAIHRVLLQNLVNRVRLRVDAFELKMQSIHRELPAIAPHVVAAADPSGAGAGAGASTNKHANKSESAVSLGSQSSRKVVTLTPVVDIARRPRASTIGTTSPSTTVSEQRVVTPAAVAAVSVAAQQQPTTTPRRRNTMTSTVQKKGQAQDVNLGKESILRTASETKVTLKPIPSIAGRTPSLAINEGDEAQDNSDKADESSSMLLSPRDVTASIKALTAAATTLSQRAALTPTKPRNSLEPVKMKPRVV